MDFLFGRACLLRGQRPGHYLPYHHGRGLKHLIVGSVGGGYAEMGAQLVFNGAANLIA